MTGSKLTITKQKINDIKMKPTKKHKNLIKRRVINRGRLWQNRCIRLCDGCGGLAMFVLVTNS